MQFIVNVKIMNIGNEICHSVRDSVSVLVYDSVWILVSASVHNSVYSSVWNSLDVANRSIHAVCSSIHNNIEDEITEYEYK